MGTLIKPMYTIPLPAGAKIKGDQVTWISKGKTKTGTLSGFNRVLVQSDVWVARYTDENGKNKKASTKCKDKAAANRILVRLENEVTQIRAGVLSRRDIAATSARKEPVADYIEKFCTRMIATGCVARHISATKQHIEDVFDYCDFQSLADIECSRFEKWIAEEVQQEEPEGRKTKKGPNGSVRIIKKTPRTINAYIISVTSFTAWCAESGYLTSDPLAKIKMLNEEVGRKKERRSLTEDELQRFFSAIHTRKYRGKNKSEQNELVYRVLLGMGLRSTELSLATPSQFDFERNRFTVKAARTKNKRPDVLPVRADLAAKLKDWIEQHEIAPNERIFSYTRHTIHGAFMRDLAAAGIDRIGPDGRSIDVHSLRRTFGTMLARAGVPLTTTQKLMRHSTPELTAKLYIDVEPIDMLQAVDKLPQF